MDFQIINHGRRIFAERPSAVAKRNSQQATRNLSWSFVVIAMLLTMFVLVSADVWSSQASASYQPIPHKVSGR
jgi:hypothetical protein